MKKLFLTLVVALFVNATFAFSPSEEPKPVLTETSKELSRLLNSVSSEEFLEKEELGKVFFVINDKNEVVVLKVEADNPDVKRYITQALNYKKLSSYQLNVGEKYFFDVEFKLKK